MPNQSAGSWKSRKTYARPLIALTVGVQAIHVLLIKILPHPVVVSNVIQLVTPIIAVFVCLHQRPSGHRTMGRRCWSALAWAFLIWAVAQGLFIYIEYVPNHVHWSLRPDDVLWTLFGLPLLLAISTTRQDTDRVAWLDKAQVGIFFAILYSLIFIPKDHLPLTQGYLIQNVALVLCCVLRLPTCTERQERRFFLRLACFLVAYSFAESMVEVLYKHGWELGSLADLAWTTPISLFVLMALWDALHQDDRDLSASRLVRAVGSFQGLSVAALTFLSLFVATLLMKRSPILGGIAMVTAFTLFAFRTNARERLWQSAHFRLEEAVLKDALTGLGNRTQLRNALTKRAQNPSTQNTSNRTVLLFADLDRFKQINDSLGHALGDRLLIEVARRLVGASAPDAVVCRLGGDEFVVLTSAASVAEAIEAGEVLLDALHAPLHLGSQQLRCSASIGVVLASPDEKADDLLRTADHAMYRAKQLGRDRVQLFDAALRAELSDRWRMEADLRDLISANAIQVAFQPIYSVEHGGICGFEALARWTHPVLGQVAPSEFITLAEESGLITVLGGQILEKACRQMAIWNERWRTNFSVSVNVSPRQFADAGLIPSLVALLERTRLSPSLLRLEITETALLTHQSVVKATLEQARAHGIRISLDDFGTGYSSLSFLLSLPVDEVKVDRSFVSNMHRDPDREELVRTVIHLGHSLGKRVVAEGVETEEDLRGLAAMGCECVQGYLISKPLSAEAVEADLPAIFSRCTPVLTEEHLVSRSRKLDKRPVPNGDYNSLQYGQGTPQLL